MRDHQAKVAKPDKCESFEHELETTDAADFKSPARGRANISIRLDNVRFGDVIKFSEHYCGEVTKITRCNYCKYMKIENCVENVSGIETDEILLVER